MFTNCLNCNTKFKTFPCRIRDGEDKFCSQVCYDHYRKNNWELRFWPKVYKTKYCWEWKGGKSKLGYGKFYFLENSITKYQAHRASWIIHFGQIPSNLCVLHKCDNPSCVNPHHLFLGTIQDNNQDCFNKGRTNIGKFGSDNFNTKLLKEQVIQIRHLYHTKKYTQVHLASMFHVSKGAINGVITYKNWKYI